jgi:hypothetical protein
MKLIDLLVQKLPKRGGWPDGALSITQDNDGSLCVWDTNDPHYDGFSWEHHTGNSLLYYWCGINAVPLSCDHKESIVTYWQYKAALAASQKPAWNGEGLPPAGCECEYQYKVHGSEWCRFECVAVDGKAVFGWSNNTPVALQSNTHNFRPLRTEAERKRNETISEIGKASQLISNNKEQIKHIATLIFNAIAAGKIPGVKMED